MESKITLNLKPEQKTETKLVPCRAYVGYCKSTGVQDVFLVVLNEVVFFGKDNKILHADTYYILSEYENIRPLTEEESVTFTGKF